MYTYACARERFISYCNRFKSIAYRRRTASARGVTKVVLIGSTIKVYTIIIIYRGASLRVCTV